MGATKTDLFSDQQNAIALIAKAIGHPARVAIINYILSHQYCICSDVLEALPLAQPTIYQHLKVLRKSGLIHENVQGNVITLHLVESAINDLENYLISLSTQLSDFIDPESN